MAVPLLFLQCELRLFEPKRALVLAEVPGTLWAKALGKIGRLSPVEKKKFASFGIFSHRKVNNTLEKLHNVGSKYNYIQWFPKC